MSHPWDYGAPTTHKGQADNASVVIKIGEVGDSGHAWPVEDVAISHISFGYGNQPAAGSTLAFATSPDNSVYTDKMVWPFSASANGGTISLDFTNPIRIPKGETGRFTLSASGTGGIVGYVNVAYTKYPALNP